MPLARAAIYAQHCDIYLVPTWDNSDTWVATLRHIAREGGQFVIGVAPLLRGSDVPEDLRGTLYGLEDDWMSGGHTTIVAPGGEVIAGPVLEREEIVCANLDIAAVQAQRRMFDPVGHYARPDVFTLHVDARAKSPVALEATRSSGLSPAWTWPECRSGSRCSTQPSQTPPNPASCDSGLRSCNQATCRRTLWSGPVPPSS